MTHDYPDNYENSAPSHRFRLVIQGITKDGRKFRPSDWAERMSGQLCTFRNRRIAYSPLLQPKTLGGLKCVVVDCGLKENNIRLYHEILRFARRNKLVISRERALATS